MAILTADILVDTKSMFGDPEGLKMDYPVAASTVIYQGGFVGLDSAGNLVMYVAPPVSTTTLTGNRFVGIALDHIASQTSAGDLTCQVLVSGAIEYALASAVLADTGAPVFVSEDNTLTKDATAGTFFGWILNFQSAGRVVVGFNFSEHQHPIIARTSPLLDFTTVDDTVLLVHQTENHNGLILLWSGVLVGTTIVGSSEDQVVITLEDSGGTTIGVTHTSTNTTPDVAGDLLQSVGSAINVATGAAIVIVPADLGLIATVTQAVAGTPAGVGNVVFIAIPIA